MPPALGRRSFSGVPSGRDCHIVHLAAALAGSEIAVQEMRKHFLTDIALRVAGVTPSCLDLDWWTAPDGLFLYPRHWECETWLRAHRPPGTPWLALDDRAYGSWPFCKNLMIVNCDTGLWQPTGKKLRERLHRLGSEMKRA